MNIPVGKLMEIYKGRIDIEMLSKKMLLGTIITFSFISTVVFAKVEHPKEIWQKVLTSVKEIQNPRSGKGSAIVSSTGNIGPKDNNVAIIDFKFKDNMTRSDMYDTNSEGGKGKRETIWSQGQKNSVVYNSSNIILEQKPTKQFYRNVGYDFHPDTFMQWHHYPISERLERFINGPGVLYVEKDANGLLNLIGKYEEPNQNHYRISRFDPAKGYRPVYMRDIIQILKDRRKDINDTYVIEWAKYGSVWYIKSAKIESVYWNKDINAPTTLIQEITIQEFDPNVPIDNNDFNIEEFGIPKGTKVIDKINNKQYMYGLE